MITVKEGLVNPGYADITNYQGLDGFVITRSGTSVNTSQVSTTLLNSDTLDVHISTDVTTVYSDDISIDPNIRLSHITISPKPPYVYERDRQVGDTFYPTDCVAIPVTLHRDSADTLLYINVIIPYKYYYSRMNMYTESSVDIPKVMIGNDYTISGTSISPYGISNDLYGVYVTAHDSIYNTNIVMPYSSYNGSLRSAIDGCISEMMSYTVGDNSTLALKYKKVINIPIPGTSDYYPTSQYDFSISGNKCTIYYGDNESDQCICEVPEPDTIPVAGWSKIKVGGTCTFIFDNKIYDCIKVDTPFFYFQARGSLSSDILVYNSSSDVLVSYNPDYTWDDMYNQRNHISDIYVVDRALPIDNPNKHITHEGIILNNVIGIPWNSSGVITRGTPIIMPLAAAEAGLFSSIWVNNGSYACDLHGLGMDARSYGLRIDGIPTVSGIIDETELTEPYPVDIKLNVYPVECRAYRALGSLVSEYSEGYFEEYGQEGKRFNFKSSVDQSEWGIPTDILGTNIMGISTEYLSAYIIPLSVYEYKADNYALSIATKICVIDVSMLKEDIWEKNAYQIIMNASDGSVLENRHVEVVEIAKDSTNPTTTFDGIHVIPHNTGIRTIAYCSMNSSNLPAVNTDSYGCIVHIPTGRWIYSCKSTLWYRYVKTIRHYLNNGSEGTSESGYSRSYSNPAGWDLEGNIFWDNIVPHSGKDTFKKYQPNAHNILSRTTFKVSQGSREGVIQNIPGFPDLGKVDSIAMDCSGVYRELPDGRVFGDLPTHGPNGEPLNTYGFAFNIYIYGAHIRQWNGTGKLFYIQGSFYTGLDTGSCAPVDITDNSLFTDGEYCSLVWIIESIEAVQNIYNYIVKESEIDLARIKELSKGPGDLPDKTNLDITAMNVEASMCILKLYIE